MECSFCWRNGTVHWQLCQSRFFSSRALAKFVPILLLFGPIFPVGTQVIFVLYSAFFPAGPRGIFVSVLFITSFFLEGTWGNSREEWASLPWCLWTFCCCARRLGWSHAASVPCLCGENTSRHTHCIFRHIDVANMLAIWMQQACPVCVERKRAGTQIVYSGTLM